MESKTPKRKRKYPLTLGAQKKLGQRKQLWVIVRCQSHWLGGIESHFHSTTPFFMTFNINYYFPQNHKYFLIRGESCRASNNKDMLSACVIKLVITKTSPYNPRNGRGALIPKGYYPVSQTFR